MPLPISSLRHLDRECVRAKGVLPSVVRRRLFLHTQTRTPIYNDKNGRMCKYTMVDYSKSPWYD